MHIHDVRHLEDSAVESYAMRSLPDPSAAEVEQHLLICQDCRDRVAETDAYFRAIRMAARRLQAEPEPARFSLKLFPAFAFCALTLAMAGIFVALPRRLQTPALIALTLVRGWSVEARGPANRPLSLRPDLEGLSSAPAYRMELLDQTGRTVWRGTAAPGEGAQVPAQQPGIYFARIYAATGELQREFALELDEKN
jgi:hypothetical protein